MATENLATLRKEAKSMGLAPSVIRGAETAKELRAIMNEESGNSKPKKKSAAVAKKKSASKKTKTNARKPDRKASASKKTPASRTTAKRSSSAKSKKSNSKKSAPQNKGGRNMLDGVDFSETDGWNPRAGSAPDRIVKALRKFKGNRQKVLDYLTDDVWDFVAKKKADGEKRTHSQAIDYLRYRISRTAWDFALRTGQHETSENRVEYGTADTYNRPAYHGVRQKAKKSAEKKTTKKRNSTKKASKPARKVAGKKKVNARAAGRKAAKKPLR